MEYSRIFSKKDKFYDQAIELYKRSFPKEERRTMADQQKIMKNKDYNFIVVTKDKQFVGFVMFWLYSDKLYFEHFCVLEELRNKGLGTQILQWLKQKQRKMILEVEPPTSEITKRRIGFYKRNGFVVNDYEYYQLPYRKNDERIKLLILTNNGLLDQKEYAEFVEYITEFVYPKF